MLFRSYLRQNYPNPVTHLTQIEFELLDKAHATISIFNAMGRKIAEPLSRELSAGEHNLEFNTAHLPSGIYFYQLSIGEHSQIKKMEVH